MSKAFPYADDCYAYPRVAVWSEDEAAELHVHCIRDTKRRRFTLVGFIGVDREEQIGQVEHLAERIGAEVIIFRGIGLDDQIVGRLMANMVTSDDYPDQWVTLTSVNWPTQTQLRIMDELIKMSADDGNNFVHEERLARRLVISVEEVRHHLQVLADIGLAEEER
jgi:hypothetical protein